ncbi:MAG TPA: hypothetical protein PLB55_11890, partial [Prosthecobacter sp.]|nr:hypothetical protein [Prosthecobacter sp.]
VIASESNAVVVISVCGALGHKMKAGFFNAVVQAASPGVLLQLSTGTAYQPGLIDAVSWAV